MILIVCGLPGTGKSFFAKALSKELGLEYIGTDIVRKEINRNLTYTKEERVLVYKYILEKITAESNMVMDGTFTSSQIRQLFISKAIELGQQIYFIETTCSEEEVKRRLAKSRPDSDADYEVYLKLKKENDPFHSPHLVLRSDTQSLTQMLEKVKQQLFS